MEGEWELFLLPFLESENNMTVASIIEQYNTERPNQIDDGLKIGWLKKCEMMIVDTIIKRHKGSPSDEVLDKHIEDFDMDTDLLIDEPYDDLYIYYLDQRIALDQNDTKRYNTSATMYNNALLTYQQKYNREHMPLRPHKHMLRHEVL